MTDEMMATIRDYYPKAEVKAVEFNGERIGYDVYLEPDDEPIGFASSKQKAVKNAIGLLISGGSLPDDDEIRGAYLAGRSYEREIVLRGSDRKRDIKDDES